MENLNDVVELIEDLLKDKETLKEILNKSFELFYEVTPYLKDLLFSLADYKVEVFTRVFKKYIENGFTREEALKICFTQSSELFELLKNANTKFSYNKG